MGKTLGEILTTAGIISLLGAVSLFLSANREWGKSREYLSQRLGGIETKISNMTSSPH